MLTDQANLLVLADHLEQAVTAPVLGRERTWAHGVATELAELERALMHHTADANAEAGVFAEVDQTRPTLVRRISELHGELSDLLGETAELRSQARQEMRTGDTWAPRWAALGIRAADLVTAVRRLGKAEDDLVLESVNTDLGAGD
jgi:hypothetical protein